MTLREKKKVGERKWGGDDVCVMGGDGDDVWLAMDGLFLDLF